MLQTAKHAKNSVAVCEQADGEIAAAALSGNNFCEIAAGHREFIPGAVGLIFEELLDSTLFRVVGATRSVGHISLAHVGHLDERHADGISFARFGLGK